jgi:hypothetical protein
VFVAAYCDTTAPPIDNTNRTFALIIEQTFAMGSIIRQIGLAMDIVVRLENTLLFFSLYVNFIHFSACRI